MQLTPVITNVHVVCHLASSGVQTLFFEETMCKKIWSVYETSSLMLVPISVTFCMFLSLAGCLKEHIPRTQQFPLGQTSLMQGSWDNHIEI